MSAQFPGYDNTAVLPSLMPPAGGFSPEDSQALYETYMPFGINPFYYWIHPLDQLGPDSPRPFQKMPNGNTYIPDFMYEAMREGRIRRARGPYVSQGRALMDAMGIKPLVPLDHSGYEPVNKAYPSYEAVPVW